MTIVFLSHILSTNFVFSVRAQFNTHGIIEGIEDPASDFDQNGWLVSGVGTL